MGKTWAKTNMLRNRMELNTTNTNLYNSGIQCMDGYFLPKPDLQHIKTMPNRLIAELRESILQIKSVWATREEYGKTVKSYDIYTAVLDDEVRTPHEFHEWLKNKHQR